MAMIKVEVPFVPFDGAVVTFKAPCDCSKATSLLLTYPTPDGQTETRSYAFMDAHGKNVGGKYELFKSESMVKVILDADTGCAFVQNGDTNDYLEERFRELEEGYDGQVTYGVHRPNSTVYHWLDFYRRGNVLQLVGELNVVEYMLGEGLYGEKTFNLEDADTGFFPVCEYTAIPAVCKLKAADGNIYHMPVHCLFDMQGHITITDIPPMNLFDEGSGLWGDDGYEPANPVTDARVYINITYIRHAKG